MLQDNPQQEYVQYEFLCLTAFLCLSKLYLRAELYYLWSFIPLKGVRDGPR